MFFLIRPSLKLITYGMSWKFFFITGDADMILNIKLKHETTLNKSNIATLKKCISAAITGIYDFEFMKLCSMKFCLMKLCFTEFGSI